MTIDEAIEAMQNEVDEHPSYGQLPYYKAHKLGMEALRRVQAMRLGYRVRETDLLPGETE